jgi:hypothetical protein
MDWLELNESRKTMKIKSMMIDVAILLLLVSLIVDDLLYLEYKE